MHPPPPARDRTSATARPAPRRTAWDRGARRLLPNPVYWLLKLVWRLRRLPRFGRAAGFREKLHYKLAFDRRPILAEWADKLASRGYASRTVADIALPRVFWCSRRAEDIPFEALPREFVLKANHGSGWSRFVFDKRACDREALVRTARAWLGQSYYRQTGEWAYRGIVPHVYAEQVLRTGNGEVAGDWNLYVFGGKVRLLQALIDLPDGRTLAATFDRLGRRLDVALSYAQAPAMDFPEGARKMIQAAEALAQGIDFVRVDLYLVGDQVFFGELSSYPRAGDIVFDPPDFDDTLGRWFVPDWTRYAGGAPASGTTVRQTAGRRWQGS